MKAYPKILLFIGLVIVFYAIGFALVYYPLNSFALFEHSFALGNAMNVHQAIADAMANGTSWGRQMLAGAPEYPPLPSIIILAIQSVTSKLEIDGAMLFTALFQALILYKIILLCGWKKCWIILAIFIPLLTRCLMFKDVGWLTAALFTTGICACVSWEKEHSLRELVVSGISFGLMAMCGVFAAILGLCGALWMCFITTKNETEHQGYRTLLLSVWMYCTLLIMLWNWLVIGNPFYAFKIDLSQLSQYAAKFRSINPNLMLALFFPLAPLCIFANKSSQKHTARFLIACFILLILYMPLALALDFPLTGTAPLTFTFLLLLCAMGCAAQFSKPVPRTAACIAIVLSLAYSFTACPLCESNSAIPPEREEILQDIDALWPDSRVILYGTKLPALYPDAQEKRFVARFEYWEEGLLKQAKEEQLHLLIPPPYLKLYKRNSELADIYDNGRPWLFLEKKYTNDWQLWRVLGFDFPQNTQNTQKNN